MQEGYPVGLRLACFGKKLNENPKDIGCVFITEVMGGGLAARCPLLARGCRILEINGTPASWLQCFMVAL